MGNEKAVSGNTIPLHSRPITRALASALRASSNLSEVVATTAVINQGRVLRANSKRTALDDKKSNNAPKRRAVLNDITNVTCEDSYSRCFNAAKIQVVIYIYTQCCFLYWFLHGNYIERQRLQLLGVTCMLIASKYEEIYAPRIEEFCFITDNTYTRDQVLEMESQVVKHFSFQIYTPTSKTFLRRFLRAAQASHVMPSVEMEFLANYLTELTLIEYECLKFLPSVIAASAVFLAKWTMNQSSHPWNPTLEHYTTYKASDLKESVQALQELQLNTKGCPLNSIRMKYKQDKFKSVSAFTSPELPDRLF